MSTAVFNNGIFRGQLVGATGTFAGQLSAGALESSFANLGTAVIDTAHIQAASIGSVHIQEAAIGSAHIKDLSVDTIKIANNAIYSVTPITGGIVTKAVGDYSSSEVFMVIMASVDPNQNPQMSSSRTIEFIISSSGVTRYSKNVGIGIMPGIPAIINCCVISNKITLGGGVEDITISVYLRGSNGARVDDRYVAPHVVTKVFLYSARK